jgi:trans-aconitate methyltransferase
MRTATDVFGEWAIAGKDAGMETGHAPAVQAMLAAAEPHLPDNFSAIDLGCGNGWVVRLLEAMGASHAAGVDGARAMIDKARAIDPAGSYHCELLPDWAPPHKVDLVHSMEFLYYLEDPASMIQAIHDHWLNPGGILVMGVDHYAEHEASLAWPEHVGVAMTTLTTHEWRAAILQAGFEVKQIQSDEVTLIYIGLKNN